MRQNEASTVPINGYTYLHLLDHLWKHHDTRTPAEIVAVALQEWMARHCTQPAERGYQWKGLFLPHGTRLRLRHHGICHFAQVEGDLLMAEGRIVTPHSWANAVCGGVRNAWRDIWVRRNYRETWTQAAAWRGASRQATGMERRRSGRRATDPVLS